MSLIKQPFIALNNATGQPYTGAKMYFYLTGTTTPTTVYSDAPLTTPLAQPILSNDEGRFPAVYAPSSPAIRMKIIASDGDLANPLIDIDPVNDDTGSVLSAAFAIAGGTGDQITGAFVPAISALSDGLIVGIRGALSNTLSNPTFKADQTPAHTITRGGGQPLIPGDIEPLGEYFLRYNLANTRWELMNPAGALSPTTVIAAASTVDLSTGDQIEINGGAATINSFGLGKNLLRVVLFTTGGHTLTNGANLVLKTGANRSIVAGDAIVMKSNGATTPIWTEVGFFPASSINVGNIKNFNYYDAGTWTPADASGAGLAITSANTNWVRTGNMVYINGSVTWPSNVNPTTAQISGLPFPCKTGYTPSNTMLYGSGVGLISHSAGNSTFTVRNSASTFLQNQNLSSGTVQISHWYPV